MTAFIKALLFVVVAEMGDKTQLLAMAMASKYKAKQVLIGVFIATIFNHALAVAVGSYLSAFIPMNNVKIVAAISFLIFGLWTLRGDKIDDENEKKAKFGPVVTVAIAFFIAEMGDKTQLMTVAISAQYQQPIYILMGTTVGMMVADSIGIIGGAWMCKNIPEVYIKWIAGVIFMFFGTLTLYGSVPASMLNAAYISLYLIIIAVLIYLAGVKFAYHDEVSNIVSAEKSNPQSEIK
ncbi:putative Ca2+/H+ antiporter (TMEM165/GDT1 family) [Clostridium pascui]|uniref:TMEM165/GDT1 family protein n=1 Tax=Clostridium pascui TaxID=46609 RepID=UPI00195778C7|nr:TMEM165/GDT1 family protein [Clostridium pascui]MBM7869891.1 putative Ca2+/H+ antiporter (TMEM165/GDT1 family) [Clostridium pascui]